jgi:hypothetical protein
MMDSSTSVPEERYKHRAIGRARDRQTGNDGLINLGLGGKIQSQSYHRRFESQSYNRRFESKD